MTATDRPVPHARPTRVARGLALLLRPIHEEDRPASKDRAGPVLDHHPAEAARAAQCPAQTPADRRDSTADRLTARQTAHAALPRLRLHCPRRPSRAISPCGTFGQLKQLWEARTDEPDGQFPDAASAVPPSSIPQSLSSPPNETTTLPTENPHSPDAPGPVTTDSDPQSNSSSP